MFPKGFNPQAFTTSFLTMYGDGDYSILSSDISKGRKFTCSSLTGDLITLLGGGAANAVMIGETHNFTISSSGMFGPRDDTGDGWMKVTIEGAKEYYYYVASGTGGVSPKASDFTLQRTFDYTTGALNFPTNSLTNSLGADVALNNTANYFDGPSVSQGTSGVWFVSGTVTTYDSGVSNRALDIKLWDGTTIISSTADHGIGTASRSTSLSGIISNPAGNLRISVKNITTTTGVIAFNSSGNSKDSTITAIRIA